MAIVESREPSGADGLGELVAPFIEAVRDGVVEIYNEISLQHELGIFLRCNHKKSLVQFERNIKHFFPTIAADAFTKREIDIAIYTAEPRALEWAIELKYPRNGQHPEQMFSFCKDVAFAEELAMAGFRRAGLVIFAEDDLFWRGPTQGIYGYFRSKNPLNGVVRKPTGAKNEEVCIRGRYPVDWKPVVGSLMYAIIEVEKSFTPL
jgi:hypothetical protein